MQSSAVQWAGEQILCSCSFMQVHDLLCKGQNGPELHLVNAGVQESSHRHAFLLQSLLDVCQGDGGSLHSRHLPLQCT